MDWKLKLLGEKVIDVIFPGELGRRVHNQFQGRFGKIAAWNEERQSAEIKRGASMAAYLYANTAFKFEQSAILEVGTGWHATDVILFYLLGAKDVWTCDQLRHLDESLVLKQTGAFRLHLEKIATECGVDIAQMTARYERLRSCQTLDSVLRCCNATYLAPQKLHQASLPSEHFDLFYSYSTLQRVPPNDLQAYLLAARRSLKPGGYSLHCIHHMDHNARHQSNLGRLHYLRYSDLAYDLLQSKRFNYQNRLRHGEFTRIFTNNNFSTIAEEVTRLPADTLASIPIAERFRRLPEEDVRIVRTQILSRRD